MVNWVRQTILSGLTQPAFVRLTASIAGGCLPILMLHRFRDADLGLCGLDPMLLRARLAEVRAQGFHPIGIEAAFAKLTNGSRLDRSVVFTVDDGYADFDRVAAPVFAEFDCPVTMFVTTGFADGDLWYWWDQVEFMLERSKRSTLSLELATAREAFSWGDQRERALAVTGIVERLKREPNHVREFALSDLARQLDVEVPRVAPSRYMPMGWGDMRRLTSRGVSFGPHSVTHPILANVDGERAVAEIAGSWHRLLECIEDPVPVFCYPNGTIRDFGVREQSILDRVGLKGAVTTIAGFASHRHFKRTAPLDRFVVPRFPYPEDRRSFWQVVGGLELLRNRMLAR